MQRVAFPILLALIFILLMVFYLVPGLISTVGTRMHGSAILNLVSTAILIWTIVELGFLRGTGSTLTS